MTFHFEPFFTAALAPAVMVILMGFTVNERKGTSGKGFPIMAGGLVFGVLGALHGFISISDAVAKALVGP